MNRKAGSARSDGIQGSLARYFQILHTPVGGLQPHCVLSDQKPGTCFLSWWLESKAGEYVSTVSYVSMDLEKLLCSQEPGDEGGSD